MNLTTHPDLIESAKELAGKQVDKSTDISSRVYSNLEQPFISENQTF